MADSSTTGDKEGTKECIDTSIERIQLLEEALKKSREEGQSLRTRAEHAEKQLASAGSGSSKKLNKQHAAHLKKVEAENESLRAALRKSDDAAKEKANTCARQCKQIEALTSQVTSLREVVSITKDLLTIRNLEVQQLQKDVDGVQEKIALEREKQEKLILAAKLNADLRKEYMNQVQLFQDLKGKYEEKVISLTNENERLTKLMQVNAEQ